MYLHVNVLVRVFLVNLMFFFMNVFGKGHGIVQHRFVLYVLILKSIFQASSEEGV